VLPIDLAKATSTAELRVRFGETDLMGIVHHGSYLLYFEVGRVEWLRKRGVTYADWASGGRHLPVVEANIHYVRPARFDDALLIETSLTNLRAVSLRYDYRVTRAGELLADGWTRLACIDERHRPVRMTEEMHAALLSAER
jgi:acyl-CoA thioester hydrolase